MNDSDFQTEFPQRGSLFQDIALVSLTFHYHDESRLIHEIIGKHFRFFPGIAVMEPCQFCHIIEEVESNNCVDFVGFSGGSFAASNLLESLVLLLSFLSGFLLVLSSVL